MCAQAHETKSNDVHGQTQGVLGDDIGEKVIFQCGNSVPQQEFLFFQSLNLDDVRPAALNQGLNRHIKIPVLYDQLLNFFLNFIIIHDHISGSILDPCCGTCILIAYFSGLYLKIILISTAGSVQYQYQTNPATAPESDQSFPPWISAGHTWQAPAGR